MTGAETVRDDPRAMAFESLVREWTGRVHNLAYRMLGNRADADDATQEVFLRLWDRIDAYDPARPFQPWIYRVATRSILNRIRGESTRAKKHAAALPPSPPETTEAAVERREGEAAVHDGLQQLDGDARALLAMHYYGGLTQEEIAEVLDAPRTTVQSRLGKALDALRGTLAGSRSLAVLPGLEDLMRGTPPLPVDERLVASLLKIAAPAAGVAAVATGTWLIGGMLVTKKLILAAVILVLLGAGGGVLAHRVLRGASTTDEPGTASAELVRLTEENRRLKADLERRGPEAPRLASATPRGPSVPATAPGSGKDATAPEAAAIPGAAAGALDWSRFSKLFAANAVKVAEMVEKDGEEKLDPADQAMMLAIFAEYMRVCAEARALSPHPFFDERVLPDLAVALFGDTLALSPDRRKALEEAARGALQAHRGEVDLDHAGALETFDVRSRIADEVLAAAGAGLDADASARLKSLQPMVRAMLMGNTTEVRIGVVAGAQGEPASTAIVTEWKEAYGLDDRQADAVRPLAARYARDAADVLHRHGLDAADANAPEAEQEAARREMLHLGVAAERAILGDLPATQRAAAGKRPVTIVLLQPGDGIRKSTMNAGGL